MKTKKENREAVLFGVYTAALLIQNILALKSIDIGHFTMTAGVLVSPFVFIAQDVQSEIYGYGRAKAMILLGYAMNLAFTILATLAIHIPPSFTYANQAAFSAIFNTTWRITLASFTAYVTGSLINAKIMTAHKNRHGLFYRAIMSTIAGQTFDNAVFSFGAFLGVLPIGAILSMVIGATLWETGYEVVIFPLTKRIIAKLDAET